MTSIYAAAQAEPDSGWGKLVALVLTALAFWVVTVGHKRWKQIKATPSDDHSSRPEQIAVTTVKPQVTAAVAVDHGGRGPGRAVAVREASAVPDDDGLADHVRRKLGRVSTTVIVREMTKSFGVSESTAWRAVRRAKGAGGEGEAL